MSEKLLLHIQYECQKEGIELPWARIAHRLHPGSSPGAITQHLKKLRVNLLAEGHLVPPTIAKLKPGKRAMIFESAVKSAVRMRTEMT